MLIDSLNVWLEIKIIDFIKKWTFQDFFYWGSCKWIGVKTL